MPLAQPPRAVFFARKLTLNRVSELPTAGETTGLKEREPVDLEILDSARPAHATAVSRRSEIEIAD